MSSFSIDSILAKPSHLPPPISRPAPTFIRPYPYFTFPPTEVPGYSEMFPRKRRKRYRTIFSESQIETLEKVYKLTPYPDLFMREEVAMKTGIQEERVEVWFKNRRARTRKMKRAQKESEAKDVNENDNEKTPEEKSNAVKNSDEDTGKETG